MKKINWNLIWNIMCGLSVIYLTLVAASYVAVFIVDGAKNTIKNASIGGGSAAFMVIALIIVLVEVYNKLFIEQLLVVRERINKKYNETKKVTSKKKSTK